MTHSKESGKTEDLIFKVWEECQSESAGESELCLIQNRLLDTLGITESPARIARILADHNVRLRHPQIVNADSAWRENQVNKWPDLRDLNFETIEDAVISMKRVEELRTRFVSEGHETGLQIVVEHARELRMALARKSDDFGEEVAQWLVIWLQNPQIFEDWLELRLKSSEFRTRFSPRL